ncbi:MAG TPA: alpha-L-arabinofuranosidase C-terminal domain-containing protein, partial [Polyangia bacterium]
MRISTVCLIAALALVATGAAAAPLGVEVDAGARLHPVSPRLFGTNLQPKTQSDDAVRALFRDLGLTTYRYPGGGWPGWHWQAGTFDNQSRWNSCALADMSYLSGFLAAVGGELLTQVNIETGTPTEAADLVTWVRDHGVPGQYFELGNEVYGDWDAGYRSTAAYVATIKSYAAAMRPRDPALRLGVDMGGEYYDVDRTADGVDTANWDRAVVGGACAEIDFLSFHWYPGRDLVETPLHVMGNSLAAPALADHLRQVVAEVCPARQGAIEVGFLEWDGVFDHETTGMRQTLANGIFNADALGQLATAGVELSNQFEASGRNYGLLAAYDACQGWPERYDGRVRPKALAIQLASRLGGGDLVAAAVTGSATYTNASQDPGNEWSGPVPYQAAYASRHADGLTLMLISRHPDQAAPATIHLTGFDPQATATVHTLTGPSLTANNETTAGTVAITESTAPVAATFSYTVPPRS